MKYICTIILILIFTTNLAIASENNATITSLIINKREVKDIEIILNQNNDVLLPVKQFAKILEIPYTENHSTKKISFQNIVIEKDKIFVDNTQISAKPYFQKEGIMDIDEFYVDEETANKLFDSEIKTDKNNLYVFINTSKLLTNNNTEEQEVQEVVYLEPQKKGHITLDTLDFSSTGISDNTKQVYYNTAQNNYIINNTTQMNLRGKAFNGDYILSMNTSNYKEDLFSFGGMGITYKNKIKDKYFYELGNVSGIKDDYYSIGTMLIGAQISNYEEKDKQEIFTDKLHYRYLGGISGFNNRLFSSNGYIYQMNTKKLVLGADYKYQLGENKQFSSKIIYDKILYEYNHGIFVKGLMNDYSLLSSGVYKNPNLMQGTSIINTFDLYTKKNYTLKAIGALSLMQEKADEFKDYKGGYSFGLENIYQKNNHNIVFNLYNQSPDYYVAGSDAGFVCDKLGANFGYKYSNDKFNLNLKYNKYFSNLNHDYSGGLISFDDVRFSTSAKLGKFGHFRGSGNLRYGRNHFGQNLNYYYTTSLSKIFKNKISSEIGLSGNSYETKLYSASENDGYSNVYNNLYANTSFRLGNKGTLTLNYNNVKYGYFDNSNGYNLVKLNYKFPQFKRFILGMGYGYKFLGTDTGNTYSLSLGYRTKTGMIISCSYQYNNSLGYNFNNIYIPPSSHHSINFTVNDTFAFGSNGLQSVGSISPNQGFVEIVSYIDKNKNGKFDRKDIRLPNVPIKTGWRNTAIYTKRNGYCPLQTVEAGTYTVKLDGENLLSTLSSESEISQNIKVCANQTTRIEFPLVSTVGNIRGTLRIIDDFNREKNISDYIITLNDLNGKEVAYSTVDDNGNYDFSGVKPGTYEIELDKNLKNDNQICDYEDKGKIKIEIPYSYKDFIDIEHQDLMYKYY